MPPDDNRWHLDKRVPIALIVTLVMQGVVGIWWAAALDGRVAVLEKSLAGVPENRERLIRIEEQARYQTETLRSISARLEKMETRQ